MNAENTKLNKDNLYTETHFSDMKLGSIAKCSPIVGTTGEVDAQRETIWFALTTIMTPQGPMDVRAQIKDVSTLDDACDKFGIAVNQHIDEMVKLAQEQQRSRIITPEEALGKSGLQIVK